MNDLNLASPKDTTQLTSLLHWSQTHTRDIFEASNDQAAIQAIEETFAKNVSAMANGKQLGLEEIKRVVLTLRKEAPDSIKLEWLPQAVQVPCNSSNRSGSFGGMYKIHGIERILPGDDKPTKLVRQKMVTVQIESQSMDPSVDSRKIVFLSFVASDVPAVDNDAVAVQ